MMILAVETTGLFASVALIDEQGQIEERSGRQAFSHLQCLVPMIGELLESCRLTIDDVTHLAVSEGPGSFTGIRIGMATAKALAQVKGIPVIPVPTLMAFTYNVPHFDGVYCPIFDARRDQVYGGAYFRNENGVHRLIPDGAYDIRNYLKQIQSSGLTEPRFMLFGDGVDRYSDIIAKWSENNSCCLADANNRYQRASSVAALSAALLAQGKKQVFMDVRPVYLRKPEAQRKLEEKRAKGWKVR